MTQRNQDVNKLIDEQRAKLKKDTLLPPESNSSLEVINNPQKPLLINHLLALKVIDSDSSDKLANYDPITNNYFKMADSLGLKVPSDNSKILKNNETIIKLLNLLQPLADILFCYEYRTIKGNIEANVKLQGSVKDNILIQQLGLEINLKSAYLLVKLGRLVNEFLIKNEFTLSEFKSIVNKTFLGDKLTLIKTIELGDIKEVIKGLGGIFPELKLPSFEPKKIVKPSNKAFKDNYIEPTPNHSTCNDILTLLIKPFEFTDNSNISEFNRINHSNKKNKFESYTQLAIPKPEKIDIEDKTFNVIRGFDWKDRKILRLILTEALKHNVKFDISLRWILEVTGELKTGGTTLEEKYNDLKKRFIKYRSTSIQWNYKLGEKINEDSISGGDIFLLNFEGFYFIYRGNKLYDIVLENVYLGRWFEINSKLINQFTRIPKKLLLINTHRHWLSFAIAEKICVLLRTQKEDILKYRSAFGVPIKLNVKTLLDEILNPEELKEALYECRKGYRLKNKILDEIKHLEVNLNWQFNWIGLTDNLSFNEFYSQVSFEAITDSELECAVLGEKLITEVITPKPKTNLTVTDLITALENHAHNPKISIRKLTENTLNKKHPWLQRRLDPNNSLFGKLTQKELKDCLSEIERLTKNK